MGWFDAFGSGLHQSDMLRIYTGEHRAFLKSKEAQSVAFPGTSEKVSFEKDELLRIEESLKVSLTLPHSLYSICLRNIRIYSSPN